MVRHDVWGGLLSNRPAFSGFAVGGTALAQAIFGRDLDRPDGRGGIETIFKG